MPFIVSAVLAFLLLMSAPVVAETRATHDRDMQIIPNAAATPADVSRGLRLPEEESERSRERTERARSRGYEARDKPVEFGRTASETMRERSGERGYVAPETQ